MAGTTRIARITGPSALRILTRNAEATAAAAAVQLCPNFPLVQNWLSTEPYFPPDEKPSDPPEIIGAMQIPQAAE